MIPGALFPPCLHVSMVLCSWIMDKGPFGIIHSLCISNWIKTVSQNKPVQDFVEFGVWVFNLNFGGSFCCLVFFSLWYLKYTFKSLSILKTRLEYQLTYLFRKTMTWNGFLQREGLICLILPIKTRKIK